MDPVPKWSTILIFISIMLVLTWNQLTRQLVLSQFIRNIGLQVGLQQQETINGSVERVIVVYLLYRDVMKPSCIDPSNICQTAHDTHLTMKALPHQWITLDTAIFQSLLLTMLTFASPFFLTSPDGVHHNAGLPLGLTRSTSMSSTVLVITMLWLSSPKWASQIYPKTNLHTIDTMQQQGWCHGWDGRHTNHTARTFHVKQLSVFPCRASLSWWRGGSVDRGSLISRTVERHLCDICFVDVLRQPILLAAGSDGKIWLSIYWSRRVLNDKLDLLPPVLILLMTPFGSVVCSLPPHFAAVGAANLYSLLLRVVHLNMSLSSSRFLQQFVSNGFWLVGLTKLYRVAFSRDNAVNPKIKSVGGYRMK